MENMTSYRTKYVDNSKDKAVTALLNEVSNRNQDTQNSWDCSVWTSKTNIGTLSLALCKRVFYKVATKPKEHSPLRESFVFGEVPPLRKVVETEERVLALLAKPSCSRSIWIIHNSRCMQMHAEATELNARVKAPISLRGTHIEDGETFAAIDVSSSEQLVYNISWAVSKQSVRGEELGHKSGESVVGKCAVRMSSLS